MLRPQSARLGSERVHNAAVSTDCARTNGRQLVVNPLSFQHTPKNSSNGDVHAPFVERHEGQDVLQHTIIAFAEPVTVAPPTHG